ncbi:MAG: extracellular solute-binding protein, partial [Collinsella sp.]|nr:extracellular solute-binding protein [Collinsella sp.]
ATNKYWHLYINGEPSLHCANQITLKSGDKVTLAYTTENSPMPDPDKIVVDPSATTPDWDAEWAGYGNSGNGSTVTDAKTPAQAAGLKWAFDWKAESGQQYANCSEPVIANGFVYIATENELIKIDSSTGKKVASAPFASKVSYTSRPIYTNGLIIVPLNGGAVQAITADKLICKWLTPGLTDLTQSSCTVVSDGEYVYQQAQDEFVEMMAWLNELYRANLLTEGSLGANASTVGQYLQNGDIALFIGSTVNYATQLKNWELNISGKNPIGEEARYVPIIFSNSAGTTPQLAITGNSYMYTMISANCKRPDRVKKLFDYLYSDEGQELVCYGIEDT